jgi:uncharacterized protein
LRVLHTAEGVWYSATDLLNWMGCAHRTALDADALDSRAPRSKDPEGPEQAADVVELRPYGPDGPVFSAPETARGDMHERAMRQSLEAQGLHVEEISRESGFPTAEGVRAAVERTREAMRAGVDVVFQAALLDAPWFGFADFLVRVDGVASDFGDFAYEIRDTKLARHPAASALIQMAHYGAILEKEQGAAPPSLVIWLGTGEAYSKPYDDAAPYVLEARRRFLAFVEDRPTTTGQPCSACDRCRWQGVCSAEWGDADLINVHRLTRQQRLQFQDSRIATIEQLASAPNTARPTGMSTKTFDRLREQAAVQTGTDPFVLIRPQSRAKGLARVPAPDPGDIYFDLEGDPFAGTATSATLDYLWAYCDATGTTYARWAHDEQEERAAFTWFMETLQKKDAEGGDWHLYHYNSYEVTSLRRVADNWPDPVRGMAWRNEVDRLVASRFVDLYFVVENGIRTQKGTTSLKLVERLAGYERPSVEGVVALAADSIVAYEQYVMSDDDDLKARLLEGIRVYNEHDVRATLATHLWLHAVSAELSQADLEDEPEQSPPSEKSLERVALIAAMRDRLLAAVTSDSGARA